jgi:hypothetical protein
MLAFTKLNYEKKNLFKKFVAYVDDGLMLRAFMNYAKAQMPTERFHDCSNACKVMFTRREDVHSNELDYLSLGEIMQ